VCYAYGSRNRKGEATGELSTETRPAGRGKIVPVFDADLRTTRSGVFVWAASVCGSFAAGASGGESECKRQQ